MTPHHLYMTEVSLSDHYIQQILSFINTQVSRVSVLPIWGFILIWGLNLHVYIPKFLSVILVTWIRDAPI
jgi:hypothetical protein